METAPHRKTDESPHLVFLLEAKTHAFMTSQYREPAFHFLWHYHDELELAWIRKGCGVRYVGRSVEAFKAGDLVLLGSRLPHTWASAANQSTSAEWSVIQFLPKNWSEDFWRLPEVHKLNQLFARAAGGLQFTGPAKHQIGQQIEDLTSHPTHSIESLIHFLTILQQLLYTPSRALNAAFVSTEEKTDPRLEHLLNWIQKYFAEPITQAQAAAEVKMSPASFSRWFKLRNGCVFHRYLNGLRVAKVCAHLSHEDEHITQTAFRCGYSNLANFNRRFREITGLTPTEFRSHTRQEREQKARQFLTRLGTLSAIRLPPKV